MVTFKVNDIEFADHVIAGTYEVNRVPEYEEWMDAKRRKHKQQVRAGKVKGSFDMFFKTTEEYDMFKDALDEVKNEGGAYLEGIIITVNGEQDTAVVDVFLDYSLNRNRDGRWKDYYEVFTVTIEER